MYGGTIWASLLGGRGIKKVKKKEKRGTKKRGLHIGFGHIDWKNKGEELKKDCGTKRKEDG